MRSLLIVAAVCIAVGGCAKKEKEEVSKAPEAQDAKVAQTANPAATQTRKPPTQPNAIPGMDQQDQKRLEKTVASSFGKGSIDADGQKYMFTMQGDMLSDDSSYGHFRFYTFFGDKKMDISGEMVCVKIDSNEKRIWLGGKIKDNASTDPRFTSGAYASGEHVYFRARPNKMEKDSVVPGAIEVPSTGSASVVREFCSSGDWSNAKLFDLDGANDLIAALP